MIYYSHSARKKAVSYLCLSQDVRSIPYGILLLPVINQQQDNYCTTDGKFDTQLNIFIFILYSRCATTFVHV